MERYTSATIRFIERYRGNCDTLDHLIKQARFSQKMTPYGNLDVFDEYNTIIEELNTMRLKGYRVEDVLNWSELYHTNYKIT